MSRLLFDRGPMRAEALTEPTEEVLRHLEATEYGTEGLSYRHGNVREKVSALPNPYYITLRKNGNLNATVALSQRQLLLRGQPYRSYYIRYFSFLQSLRRPNRQQPDRKPVKAGNRLLRPLLWNMFDRTDPVQPDATPEPTLYYAYVEADNQRSQEMCRGFGFEPLRTMTTVPFSRLYPKPRVELRPLQPWRHGAIRDTLKEYYRDHGMVTFDTVFAGHHYYVWEENGTLLGGLQAYPITWEFLALPGLTGWLSMKVVPHIPVLRKIFNPKAYQFAAVEGLWCAPGREDILLPMLEAALAQESLTVAMLFMDKHGPLHAQIKQHEKDLGLMYTINGAVDSQIIGRFAHANPNDPERFRQAPAYISAFDCT